MSFYTDGETEWTPFSRDARIGRGQPGKRRRTEATFLRLFIEGDELSANDVLRDTAWSVGTVYTLLNQFERCGRLSRRYIGRGRVALWLYSLAESKPLPFCRREFL